MKCVRIRIMQYCRLRLNGVPALLLILSILLWDLLRVAQRLHEYDTRRNTQQNAKQEAQRMGRKNRFSAGDVADSLVCRPVRKGKQSLIDGVIVMPYTQTVLMRLAGWSMGLYYKSRKNDQAIKLNRGRTMACRWV